MPGTQSSLDEIRDVEENPIFNYQVGKFVEGTDRLTADTPPDAVLRIAETLCEASRAIVFRSPRLNRKQAATLIDAFSGAVTRIESIDLSNSKDREWVTAYKDHIQKRIDMLLRMQASRRSTED